MGSDPTLDQQRGIRWGRDGDQPDRYALGGRDQLLAHLQTPAALGGHEFGDWPASEIANGFRSDLAARHRHDHTQLAGEFPHTHPERTVDRAEGERAFDRLNPEFGIPADQLDPLGRRAVQEREAGLALGTRVAVAASRENDPDPVLRIQGQDYRAADAARTARLQTARARRDPARAGAER